MKNNINVVDSCTLSVVEETEVPALAMRAAATTRQSSTIYGLGNAVTKDDGEITGSRLPTSRQVLRCMMHHVQEGASTKQTRWESAKLVLTKLLVFFEKANIPTISERKACERIIKLLDDNAKIRAIPRDRRSMPISVNKLKQMDEQLARTFPLWSANAEQLIKNAEDRSFLESMKSTRSATFGSRDKASAAKCKRRDAREQSHRAYRNRVLQESSATITTSAVSSTESDDVNSDVEETADDCDHPPGFEPSLTTPRSHHRISHTGTPVVIPHDITQRPKLVALATRMKITPSQQAAYTAALIAESGGDVSKVSTSYATTDRSRRHVVQQIAESSREQWVAPRLATLHWDSKLIPTLSNRNISEERLTVIVGTAHEVKLLGVPSYQPGTDTKSGQIISDLTCELLGSWGCTDSIVNMTFDTTASNTGHVTAACVTIQKKLDRALLWSACRHHVGEVVLSHVFSDLKIEASKSPDVTLFTRFRKSYELLPHDTDQPLSRFDLTQFDEPAQQMLAQWRNNVLQLAATELSLKRDDYREYVELCTVYLNGPTSQLVTFKRPGALHKARWMAKLLYAIKICLFEQQIQQLPAGTVTTQKQVPAVRKFVNFVTLIYSIWWMNCSSVVDAPWHDLQFFQQLLSYETVDPLVAKSALKAFQKHQWYLTAEMVPFALFSSKVPAEVRSDIAKSMLLIKPETELVTPQNRFGTGYGKPQFQTVTSSTSLGDLVGLDSWFTFHILQLDAAFLTDDVADWPHSAAFQASAANVQAINVINDSAERGVKLSSDYVSAAKTERHYQHVLQVVEHDRKEQPNLRKRPRK